MNKINYANLKQFDLTFPGHWIEGEDREKATQTFHILSLIQNLYTEAVVSCALFRPITAENAKEYLESSKSIYERCLNGVYAKTFVFAFDGIEKLLHRVKTDLNPPAEVERLYKEYKKQFGHLKHIRDSAIHLEDRGRGLTRRQKRITTGVIVIGGFIESRYTFTGEDGRQYEIEISDKTVNRAKAIIQQIIDSYSWM